MENQSRYTSYLTSGIPVSDMLKQLHVSSTDEKYWHSSRQSNIDYKPTHSPDFNVELAKNAPHAQAIDSSSSKSLTLVNKTSTGKSRLGLGLYEQSLERCRSKLPPPPPPSYSNQMQYVPASNESSKIITSVCKQSDNEAPTEFDFRRNIAEETKKSHEKFINVDSQPTVSSFSSSTELLRTSPGIFISPCYSGTSSFTHENFSEKDTIDKTVYSLYPDTPVRFSQQGSQDSISPNYLYVPHHKSYLACSPVIDKATGDMNGYMYDNLATGTKPDLMNGSEECEYPGSLEFSSIPSLSTKETVEILGPEEVRWFYKTEGDKKWTPFIGYDSIKIEWAYREFVHKSITEDRRGNASCVTPEPGCDFIIDSEIPQNERPVVCGGLYEVDVSTLKGYSIYWKAEEFIIMRGTWFYEGSWMPVEANIARQIEMEHLIHFQGSTITSDLMEKDSQQVIYSLTLNEGEVDWYSPCDIFFSHDATPSRLMRSVSKKLGFQKTGYKLHRGYCLDASSDDKPPDITHIVFVIHGIGQKMEMGRIIKNCTSLRENVKWIKEKQFPDCDFSNQTVEFFPVEWRSSLTLDAGIIESITPHKIIGLRQMLNASFMDIMYYNSPQYREEIVNGLATELNRLYTMFTARNPYFEANGGKVSVIAHSLGCVITYDIVTGWSPAPQMSQSFLQALINLTQRNVSAEGETTLNSFQSALQHVLQQQLDKSTQPRLRFKIENFFCLGSPLAVFLGLRRMRQDKGPPAPFLSQGSFHRLFNIFHPADPVAYRIEPLICPKFSSVAPMTIHSYTSTDKKISYDEIPPEPLSLTPRSFTKGGESSTEQLETETLTTFALPTTPCKGTTAWNFWNFMKQPKKGVDASFPNKSVEDDLSEALKHRMDFVLREGSMESSYLSALTSHTSYWGNMDVAFFLLSTFCPHLLEKTS